MAAPAKNACDFVDIDNVITPQTDFVFSVDGVEEYGDFRATHFAQGVDDVVQFYRRHGVTIHVFGSEVAIDDFPV